LEGDAAQFEAGDVTPKYLIDECLSLELVAVAKSRGSAAEHLTHLGKAGWQDWNIASFAVANDYVLVTNNRRDFLRYYSGVDIHGGLIILIPSVRTEIQLCLFAKALDAVHDMADDPVNRLIEVLTDGTVHVRAWSTAEHGADHIAKPRWR
jgi:predicted nuclease of predicted toxin-antitoxin system